MAGMYTKYLKTICGEAMKNLKNCIVIEIIEIISTVKFVLLVSLCSRLIVTELCDGTLHDLVHKDSPIKLNSDQLRDVLCQITKGVEYLHNNNIIHRDLKPHNILYRTSPELVMKVADFGCSRHIPKGENQYERSVTNKGYSQRLRPIGTKGWLASEVLNGVTHLKPARAIDISPLGLIFAFTLLGGCHPHGEDAATRDDRIKSNKPMPVFNQQQLMKIGCYDLVNWMMDPNPEWRPTAAEVLKNNYFTSQIEQKPLVGINSCSSLLV